MKFKIPSYSNMVRIFILIGPLLWLAPYMLIFPYGIKNENIFGSSFLDISKLKSITDPLSTMLSGGMVWWILVLVPSFWLLTWIPTTLAALVYRSLLNISHPNLIVFNSRTFFAIYNAILSTAVSASIFTITSFIAMRLITTDTPLPMNVWIAYISVVAIVGCCLGFLVGLIPKFTPKI